MLKQLTSRLKFCKDAVLTEFKRSKMYKFVSIISMFLVGWNIVSLFANVHIPIPTMSWRIWIVLASTTLIMLLLLVIEAVYRFDTRATSETNAQHGTKINELSKHYESRIKLLQRNADIIARLGCHKGEGRQIMRQYRKQALPENEANDWTEKTISYLDQYALYDYGNDFKSDSDAKLLQLLPDQVPADPDELRRLRMEARLRMLDRFINELSRIQ
jgi:hypothetical protein